MQKQTLESIVGLVMESNRLTDGNFFRLLLIAEMLAGGEQSRRGHEDKLKKGPKG